MQILFSYLINKEYMYRFGTYLSIFKWSDSTTLKERDLVDNPIFVDYREGF